ncbi:manganese efflux pump MntP [Pseudoalteromonas piscicida]|uniref:manganese efflux pump MntP n=1 Tax=Pseudoalteromonas piscicida TaxID=43662 RepID=UPI001C96E561|nr:manganese efflux pump MntP family protein [Pseudoalteromonas piscicida]QZO15322.1 manganese efflux pump MntP family protein [Pseudoalteromonas piscicida]
MNFVTLLLLAYAMSTDAFAAAIGKGASLKSPRLTEAIKIGFIFGIIEASTPLIGWLIGQSAAGYVEAWDHWIAFILLLGLGAHMIYESLKGDDDAPTQHAKQPWLKTIITAFGTSIDAMAVGVSLAFVDVNIWLAAALIGLATTMMVTIGVMIGHSAGKFLGSRAETFGGVTLICVGTWLLYSHLSI